MSSARVSAIVLAAGLSTRMGRPKPLLPFGRQTLIRHVVGVLLRTGVAEILVVTGHAREAVENELTGWPVRCVFNPDYAGGEMLSSVQAGLRALSHDTAAALIALSDQPNLAPETVDRLIEAYRTGNALVVQPAFGGRPGHPILIDRRLWSEIIALPWTASMRDVLRTHPAEVLAVPVDAESVLRDLDTPEDYARELERWEARSIES